MEPEALILIEGEIDAMRLIASWPNLSDYEDRVEVEWSRISGVDIEDIERWEPILVRNGIIGPEGFVDEEAVRFIRAKLAAKAPRSAPKEVAP